MTSFILFFNLGRYNNNNYLVNQIAQESIIRSSQVIRLDYITENLGFIILVLHLA